MKAVFIVALYWLVFWTGKVLLVPLPETRSCVGGWSHSQTQDGYKRVRRNIPEWDAMNPAHLDDEALPDQGPADDPQKDISHFALTDHVSNFFRSHKNDKTSRNTHIKAPSPKERSESLAKMEEAVDEEDLRSDESADCYKQQNIDIPGAEEVKPRKAFRKKPKALMAHMALASDVDNKPQRSRLLGDMWKNKHGINNDDREILSLYSNPEKFKEVRKFKEYRQPKKPDRFDTAGRVYKPIDAEAQFPVYDEDIDFDPDPLQGILDEKYWLDPQEQESVIKKYIDLAANNMVPPELEYVKRSVPKAESNVQSVDSGKTELKCPCLDVVACGECGKGKTGNKSSHAPSEDAVSYGRRLLSTDYDTRDDEEGASQHKRSIILEPDNSLDPNRGEDEGAQTNEDTPSFTSNYFGRKLLTVQNIGDSDVDGDTEGEVVTGKEQIYMGRSLLWHYDENEEPYDDDDEDEWENGDIGDPVAGDNGFSPMVGGDEEPKTNTRPLEEVQGIKESDKSYHRNGESITDEDFVPIKSAPLDLPKKPGYYSSNKLGNLLQKPFQKKPKKSQWNYTTINPNYEFELLQNETFKNVSEPTEENNIIVDDDNTSSSNTSKIRRSYVEMSAIKSPRGMPMFADGPGRDGAGDLNKTTTASQSMDSSNTTAAGNNSITSTNGNTTERSSTTRSKTSVLTSQSKSSTTPKSQDLVDSEVANDIVKTVISDAQRNSILGHRLGVCRKDENVGNKNRAGYISETEKLFKSVSDCIISKLKSRLAKHSCIVLDDELRDFLSWMVLGGESYKEYIQKVTGRFKDIQSTKPPTVTTCIQVVPTPSMCEPDPLFPIPDLDEILAPSNSSAVQ